MKRKCKACSRKIVISSKVCPYCGTAAQGIPKGFFSAVIGILFVVVIILVCYCARLQKEIQAYVIQVQNGNERYEYVVSELDKANGIIRDYKNLYEKKVNELEQARQLKDKYLRQYTEVSRYSSLTSELIKANPSNKYFSVNSRVFAVRRSSEEYIKVNEKAASTFWFRTTSGLHCEWDKKTGCIKVWSYSPGIGQLEIATDKNMSNSISVPIICY